MTTYDTSDRYALRALEGTNPISDIDGGFVALRDDVSAKLAPHDAGTRASRPVSTIASPSGKVGRTYRSTGDGGIDLDYGTGWVTIKPGLFTALPTASGAGAGLDEGMEILYQTAGMATAEVGPWTLRYNSSLSGTSKWKVLAADPWVEGTWGTAAGFTTGAFSDWSAGGPTIALPSVGDYLLEFGAHLSPSIGPMVASITLVATGLTASVSEDKAYAAGLADNSAGLGAKHSISSAYKAIAISGTLKQQQRTTAVTVFGGSRFISARPLRLG